MAPLPAKHCDHLAGGLEQDHGLNARDLKAFAASRIFADDQVIPPNSIGSGVDKSLLVLLRGAGRKRGFLLPKNPVQIIFRRLSAGRTVQCRRIVFFRFGEKVSFFHTHAAVIQVLTDEQNRPDPRVFRQGPRRPRRLCSRPGLLLRNPGWQRSPGIRSCPGWQKPPPARLAQRSFSGG